MSAAEWRHLSVGLAGMGGILVLSVANRSDSAIWYWTAVALVAIEIARRIR